jgi:hypothetical protein
MATGKREAAKMGGKRREEPALFLSFSGFG